MICLLVGCEPLLMSCCLHCLLTLFERCLLKVEVVAEEEVVVRLEVGYFVSWELELANLPILGRCYFCLLGHGVL